MLFFAFVEMELYRALPSGRLRTEGELSSERATETSLRRSSPVGLTRRKESLTDRPIPTAPPAKASEVLAVKVVLIMCVVLEICWRMLNEESVPLWFQYPLMVLFVGSLNLKELSEKLRLSLEEGRQLTLIEVVAETSAV